MFAFLYRYHPVFEDAGSQPFLDEPDDAPIADPMLQEADHPFLGNFREKRPDIGVEYEVYFLGADPDDERIQRIVLAASRSEPVRKTEEFFLVNRTEHCCHGPLDDLVFKGCDRERALTTVFLRDIAPSGRLRPIRSCVDPYV